MAYLVDITVRAQRDLNYLSEQINAKDSVEAAHWLTGLESAICTLEQFPRRCPSAPESGRAKHPLRNLLYGRKPDVYRVIYEIDERRRVVSILTIRHGAMDKTAVGGS